MNKIKFSIFFALLISIILPINNPYARIVDTIEALQKKSIGDETAPIKMVEFASLTCGHCARFHNEVFPLLKKDYIDNGKIFYVSGLSIR